MQNGLLHTDNRGDGTDPRGDWELPKLAYFIDVGAIFVPGVGDVVRTGSALTAECNGLPVIHSLVSRRHRYQSSS